MKMRDRTPKARETSVPPPVTSPAEEKLAQLRALVDKIENHRSSLDGYLDAYARLICLEGVPVVNIRTMIDAKGRGCICQSAMFAIAERVEALLLDEEKQKC
jgi:hypothetical protein